MAVPTPRNPSPRSTATRERILDAAEALLAERGYDATSIRDVTGAAGTSLAAVNYHFGSKAGLYRAVFERRVGTVNAERIARLDALERAGRPPELEELLDALFGPPLRLAARREAGFDRFMAVVGRAHSATGEHAALMREVFREVETRFLPALVDALPGLGRRELLWRMHFLISALAGVLVDPVRIRVLTDGECRSDDPDELLAAFVAFAAGALRGGGR